MARSTQRRPAWTWTTLIVSLALAASLGATLYFAVSSLPFLAVSPATDPVFGALNACLHHAVPSRTGFTAAPDARAAAAWSTNTVARCQLDTDATRVATWPIAGVTVGALARDGALWVVSQPGGLTSTLHRLSDAGDTTVAETGAIDLAASAEGVVLLEASGRLVAFTHDAQVSATAQAPLGSTPRLALSADGRRVAVTGAAALLVYDAQSLAALRVEAPCEVRELWWLREGHRVLLSCAPDGLLLRVDTDTGGHDVVAPPGPPPSTLLGPAGVFVQACDLLPCSATETPP